MWLKWLPWRFLVRRAARAHGFLDPLTLAARVRRFAQPSEVDEPIELLRAGAVFHARGLLNSRVLQHNRDWVWPYWVERQFDPRDPAFVPRAFSLTHVNLTHRNWTAIGLPDEQELPIVDPRGLLTPSWDGWSLDCWVMSADGDVLAPSREVRAEQSLWLDEMRITTSVGRDGKRLWTDCDVVVENGRAVCRLGARAIADEGGWLVVAVRPCNPEGVSLIHEIALTDDRRHWSIDGHAAVSLNTPVDRHVVSTYRDGDVLVHLRGSEDRRRVVCEVGMATAAALYHLKPGEPREMRARVRLPRGHREPIQWSTALRPRAVAQGLDRRSAFLYEAALRTLVLLSPGPVYPGPYTYRRFWFRDATFVLYALLCAGFTSRVERAMDLFPRHQTSDGFFRSQDGEWDSNGQVLWLMGRYAAMTGRPLPRAWRKALVRGADWIVAKRMPRDGSPHSGLLPAGFSAEHLGPNDFYYWDDHWSVAGLEAAASVVEETDPATATRWREEADDLRACIADSQALARDRLRDAAIPASPSRRLDGGAVGSLVAAHPLGLTAVDDPAILATARFLLRTATIHGALFHDVVHSGINAYLTLQIAQVLRRAGDPGHVDLVRAVADLASPTGQWPEAIHPHTFGGCMGDGQHAWAAAEWVLAVRNAFVCEEGDMLVLGSGLMPEWLDQGRPLRFGPAPTAFGAVTVVVKKDGDRVDVSWEGEWRRRPAAICLRPPGQAPQMCHAAPMAGEVEVGRCAS